NPWIAKYIFPGGYIPALSEVLPAVERAGLLVTDIEILRLHYAETLKAWRERFLAHREEVEKLYDARFTRMWEFYLAASEMAFRQQAMMVFQLQLTKRQGVVPMTRDYIAREEARLRALESGGRPPLRLAGEGFCSRRLDHSRSSRSREPAIKSNLSDGDSGGTCQVVCLRTRGAWYLESFPVVVRGSAPSMSAAPRCRHKIRTLGFHGRRINRAQAGGAICARLSCRAAQHRGGASPAGRRPGQQRGA